MPGSAAARLEPGLDTMSLMVAGMEGPELFSAMKVRSYVPVRIGSPKRYAESVDPERSDASVNNVGQLGDVLMHFTCTLLSSNAFQLPNLKLNILPRFAYTCAGRLSCGAPCFGWTVIGKPARVPVRPFAPSADSE